MVAARRVTLAAVLVAVLASLAFDTGLGTPSSFGIGEFFLLCPLGGLEAMIASRAFIPVAAISAGVVLVMSLVFGRAWCAWGCPAPVIRRFFKREPKHEEKATEAAGIDEASGVSDAGETVVRASASALTETVDAPAKVDTECVPTAASSCSAVREAWSLAASLRHIGRDPRTWTLIAVLAAALIAGLPLFCLVCPIGLTFGTVGSLWHLIVDKQMTASVVVFPLALLVELVLYRKWCMNLCPVAGLLNITGQFARLFRPRINKETCLRANGAACDACKEACAERIDQHAVDAPQQLGECTRCGECAKRCPTASIEFHLR